MQGREPAIVTATCAVLFDVGGPLDMEIAWEMTVDSAIAVACAAERIPVDQADLEAASARAVAAFAPDTYAAMIEDLCGGDPETSARVQRRMRATLDGLDVLQLRPGIAELLPRLGAAGYRLGLVANQPADALARLERVGIARHFAFHGLSGLHGMRKPDPALFIAAADGLGVPPRRCIVVGDRIDNDIAPARRLGMATIRFRCGRHARQQARTPEEAPDREVVDVLELADAIDALAALRRATGEQPAP